MKLRTLLLLVVAALLLAACSQSPSPDAANSLAIIGEQPAPSLTTLSSPATLYAQLDNTTNVYVSGGGFEHPDWIVADEFIVPSGEVWTVAEVGFPSIARFVLPTYTVTFFAANATEPHLPGAIVSQQTYTYEDTTVRDDLVIIPLPTSVNLTAGTYWLGIDGWFVNVRVPFTGYPAVRGDIGSFSVIDLEGFGGINEPVDLAFALFGVSTPEAVTPQDVLDAFDDWVADSDIVGAGPGKSAANRVNTLRNMLVNAQYLIDMGDYSGACMQLTDAQKRIHVSGPVLPSHFVTGAEAMSLYSLIEELKASIGCG